MKKLSFVFIVMAVIVLIMSGCQKNDEKIDIIDFEELDPGDDGYWNGSDNSGGFESGNAFFPVDFTDWGGGVTSWSGFAYSSLTDTVTAGYANQYSCFAGSGAGGSSVFAVCYSGDTIEFDIPEKIEQLSVANTTYAALDMKNGSQFSKQFGGPDGNDPDWFAVTFTGIGSDGQMTGDMTVYLADFRSDNKNEDYISNSWNEVSLDFMGFISKLAVSFSSSDTGDWGINTPAYVCLDNVRGVLEE